MPRLAPVRSLLARFSAVVGVLLVCAGCTSAPDVSPTSVAPSQTLSAAPTDPATPTLHPDGTAADNLPLFTEITTSVWASAEPLAGRAYIDALVAAGFDKSAMQVTNDLTSLSKPIDTLMFSVRWNDQCLLGQVGPSTGDPVATIAPVLETGACLVGITRPIDW